MWNTSGAGRPSTCGERADRPHPADAGQDLLLDPVFLVAAVEPVGDAAQLVLVLRDVGIQQQQRNPAHLRDPDPRPQPGGVGQRQLDQHRVAGGVGEQPQRQPLRVQRRVVLVLPAVGGQRLPEVARAVVQADRDQRQAQIRRGLEVIAGQDAQAAGVVRQHLGNAELHREVRDAGRQLRARPRPAAGTTAAGSGSRPGRRPARRAGAGTTRRRRSSSSRCGADRAQQRDRIASAPAPTASGSIAANRSCVGLSHDQRRLIDRLFERGKALGQMGADGEPAEGLSRDSTLLTIRRARSAVWRSLRPRVVGPTTTVGIGRPRRSQRL